MKYGGFRVAKLKSSPRNYYGRYYDLVDHYEIYVPQLTGYVSFVVYTIMSFFLLSLLIIECLKRATRWVQLLEREVLTLTVKRPQIPLRPHHFWTYTSNLTKVVKSVLKFMISGTTSILKS